MIRIIYFLIRITSIRIKNVSPNKNYSDDYDPKNGIATRIRENVVRITTILPPEIFGIADPNKIFGSYSDHISFAV